MSAIERLENWKHGHKARSVSINIDDGYGAACWTVELVGEKLNCDLLDVYRDDEKERFKHRTRVTGSECLFCGTLEHLPLNAAVAGTEDEPFVGLATTIHAAIDRWEHMESLPERAMKGGGA